MSFEYSESAADVAALLQDPVFLRYRSESGGERNVDVRAEQTTDGLRITVSREKTVDVPAFARAVVGSASRAVETTLWRKNGDSFTADYEIDVSGLPIKAHGQSRIEPRQGGCLHTSSFEVRARIPLIGARLEALVADGLKEQLEENARRNAEALRRNKERREGSFIEGLRPDAGQVANKA